MDQFDSLTPYGTAYKINNLTALLSCPKQSSLFSFYAVPSSDKLKGALSNYNNASQNDPSKLSAFTILPQQMMWKIGDVNTNCNFLVREHSCSIVELASLFLVGFTKVIFYMKQGD